MLQQVAQVLSDLREDLVFVGGAVAELYADDPAASDIRPTIDVDCVVFWPPSNQTNVELKFSHKTGRHTFATISELF